MVEGNTYYTNLEVDLDVESMPKTRMLSCGHEGSRSFGLFQLPYYRGNKLFIARSERIPTYRCEPCDYEVTDLGASVLFLKAARTKVLDAGDSVATERINASIKAFQQVITNNK